MAQTMTWHDVTLDYITLHPQQTITVTHLVNSTRSLKLKTMTKRHFLINLFDSIWSNRWRIIVMILINVHVDLHSVQILISGSPHHLLSFSPCNLSLPSVTHNKTAWCTLMNTLKWFPCFNKPSASAHRSLIYVYIIIGENMKFDHIRNLSFVAPYSHFG